MRLDPHAALLEVAGRHALQVRQALSQLVVQGPSKGLLGQCVATRLVGELHNFDAGSAKPCLWIVSEEQQGHVAGDPR